MRFDRSIEANQELGPGVEESKFISHTVRVNVFRSIEFLLTYSEPLRALVKSGNLTLLQILAFSFDFEQKGYDIFFKFQNIFFFAWPRSIF